MKNEALDKVETNLEKAKRLTKDNAAIKGIDLPDDNFFFKMIELAATPDKKECEGQPVADTESGLHLADVRLMLPEEICKLNGHAMYSAYSLTNTANGHTSHFGLNKCSRCNYEEPWQFDM